MFNNSIGFPLSTIISKRVAYKVHVGSAAGPPRNPRSPVVSGDQVVAPHHHMIQDPRWYLVISWSVTGGHGKPREAMGFHGEATRGHGSTGSHGSAFKLPSPGSPLGGPSLVRSCFLDCIWLLVFPLLSWLSFVLCMIEPSNFFRPVARVLLLLHLPRLSFHDSTGFKICCLS